MLNWSIAPINEDVWALKASAKALLDAIVDLHVAGTPDACAGRHLPEGETAPRTWRLPASPVCATPGHVHSPADGQPLTAHFCPECWQLDLHDAAGAHVAHATQWLRKRLSELPPGSKITGIRIGDERIPVDPPIEVGGKAPAPANATGPRKLQLTAVAVAFRQGRPAQVNRGGAEGDGWRPARQRWTGPRFRPHSERHGHRGVD